MCNKYIKISNITNLFQQALNNPGLCSPGIGNIKNLTMINNIDNKVYLLLVYYYISYLIEM